MGLVVLNRRHLDLGTIKKLYRKLRNLEVNSLKRFVVVDATTEVQDTTEEGEINRRIDAFAGREKNTTITKFQGEEGLSLLRMCESSSLVGERQKGCAEWFFALQELAYLCHSYTKPLLFYLAGQTANASASISCLSNRSCAYHQSSFVADSCAYGGTPLGGMSYLLSSLPDGLDILLPMTGLALHGVELLTTGLSKSWVPPEAFPFMELTASKHLEVSESDGLHLLQEHFMDPSLACLEASLVPFYLEAVSNVLDDQNCTLQEMKQRLKEKASSLDTDKSMADWLKLMARRVEERSPVALAVTIEMVRRLKKLRFGLYEKLNFTSKEMNIAMNARRLSPRTTYEDSVLQLYEEVEGQCLKQALIVEARVMLKLLTHDDLLDGLRWNLSQHLDSDAALPHWVGAGWVPVSGGETERFFEPTNKDELFISLSLIHI
eukprot:TRINITY_DN141718_c0_g1_i1.p1 TRINITY_DN141718_c0_g1~~TRINITY_DN141718_c0_g1_i1.p1  ORF type:complete len:435 (+),score=29.80 TRINITY_DN141718_c0_g1_i1:150-1454(+)